MKTSVLRISLIILICIQCKILFSQEKIGNSVIGNGGKIVQNTNHQIKSTVGQPLIGTIQNSTHINQLGFWYQITNITTDSKEFQSDVFPSKFQLKQNYPNPFNPVTTIEYELSKPGEVTIHIYDLQGHHVKKIECGRKNTGYHFIQWNGINENGLLAASGVYFYRIEVKTLTGNKRLYIEAKKMILMK